MSLREVAVPVAFGELAGLRQKCHEGLRHRQRSLIRVFLEQRRELNQGIA